MLFRKPKLAPPLSYQSRHCAHKTTALMTHCLSCAWPHDPQNRPAKVRAADEICEGEHKRETKERGEGEKNRAVDSTERALYVCTFNICYINTHAHTHAHARTHARTRAEWVSVCHACMCCCKHSPSEMCLKKQWSESPHEGTLEHWTHSYHLIQREREIGEKLCRVSVLLRNVKSNSHNFTAFYDYK